MAYFLLWTRNLKLYLEITLELSKKKKIGVTFLLYILMSMSGVSYHHISITVLSIQGLSTWLNSYTTLMVLFTFQTVNGLHQISYNYEPKLKVQATTALSFRFMSSGHHYGQTAHNYVRNITFLELVHLKLAFMVWGSSYKTKRASFTLIIDISLLHILNKQSAKLRG